MFAEIFTAESFVESPPRALSGGALADLVAVELLAFVFSRTLTLSETLEISRTVAPCVQLSSPVTSIAALRAWEDPRAWSRCQQRVRRALERGRHRRFAASLPCPTSWTLGAPSVEEVWELLEQERAFRLNA